MARGWMMAWLLVATGASQTAAAIEFEDTTVSAGIDAQHEGSIFGCGQAIADVDGGGWQDLFVAGHEQPNRLFLNQGDGTFAEFDHGGVLSPVGAACGSAAFGDYDNDGWPDLYLTCLDDNYLFRNQQGTGFADVTQAAGVNQPGRSQAVAWGDINADGWLDLYVGRYPESGDPDPGDSSYWDSLFLNDGDGTFTSIAGTLDPAELVKTVLAASFTDIDNDGDVDLYVVNDRLDGNTLWRNDGPGCGGWCLTNIAAATGADRPVYGMGIAVGDTDLDGDLDLYFSSIGEQVYLENQLSETGGTLDFIERSDESGLDYAAVGWATHFFDLDNDRRLDAYLAVMNDPPPSDRVFRNLPGQIEFADVSAGSGASDPEETLGASQWDYDRDGRQDLVTCNVNEGYKVYRNVTAEAGDWLEVELIGGGSVNRDAIGSRVTLTSEDGMHQIREVTSGQGRAGNSMFPVHFGLGDQTVSTLTVDWPDGAKTIVDAPDANRYLRLVHPEVQVVFSDGFE